MRSDRLTYIPSVWKPPPKGAFKINFDAAWSQGRACLGILVNGHVGIDIYGRVIKKVSISTETVETKALKMRINFALQFTNKAIYVEEDAKCIIDALLFGQWTMASSRSKEILMRIDKL